MVAKTVLTDQEILNKARRPASGGGVAITQAETTQEVLNAVFDATRDALVVYSEELPALETRIETLEDKYVYALYFLSVTSPTTSGTITLPVPDSAIVVDGFEGLDVLVNQLSGGLPIDESALDSGGNIITGALSGTGNLTYTLTVPSGSYSGTVAVVYHYLVKLKSYDATYDLNPRPVYAGLSSGDVRGTTDQVTVTVNADGTITLSLPAAVTGKLVTNGDSHDHLSGDGGTIAHTSLSGVGTNTHAQIDTFVSSKAQASGLASLDVSSKVVQDPANATSTPTGSKIPIASVGGKLDGWITAGSTSAPGIVELATEEEHEAGTSEALAATPHGVTVIVRDALRDAVEAATGGQVTIVRDDLDNPSWMVIVPKFRCEDVDVSGSSALGTGVHPAFIVNGTEKPYFMVGQYLASLASGRGVSIPGVDPAANLNFDAASGYCTAKGSGWHLITNWEWSAIALWCLANGYQPRGNTYYGRHHTELHECGRRQDGEEPGLASGVARTYTGSGPNAWRHNNAANGVDGLVGNISEWCGGLKLVDGLIYMPSDNYYDQAEASWPSTTVYMDGTATGSSGDVGDVRLNSSVVNSSGSTAYFLNAWTATGVSEAGYTGMSTAIKQMMMRACVDPSFDTTNPVGSIYCRNAGERLPIRGGGWNNAASAGLFALNLINVRSTTLSSFGFRLAYIG